MVDGGANDGKAEDEDKQAPAATSSVPNPHRAKVHSYSQQLCGEKKPYRQRRKHSLDDIPGAGSRPLSSSDDDFSNYSLDEDDGTLDLKPFPPLPEFIAAGSPATGGSSSPGPAGGSGSVGGGKGEAIFKVPTRAAVHPGRPPCLELRPHPLRETQVGKFLRNIACTDTQLWAGQESGVRFWKFDRIYDPGCGLGGKVRRGDEDAAPFHESASTSPTVCLMVDAANRLVWSGHKDGKIRSWKTDQFSDDGGGGCQPADSAAPFKEGLSWQAHKGPVLSMVMSSYGDLWSGSEGGVIKIWPWESIEKSLSLKSEEKRMAALLVERSAIDLRSQVTVNGACSISSSDIKCLLSDNVRAKLWCAQSLTFSLWDARTKELLRVFNIDGQTETRVDGGEKSQQQQQQQNQNQQESRQGGEEGGTTTPQEAPAAAVEKPAPAKGKSGSNKKEKSQGFLQRSRNAIMGAADAVRRVATRGTNVFVEDQKKTEAVVMTAGGMIWSGCTNGLIIQWDGNGNRVQDFNLINSNAAVQCFCTFGNRIYVGYASGVIQVMDLEGHLLAMWVAHSNPVLKLAVGKGYIYSLASHGGIRGWNTLSPSSIDQILRSELAGRELTYTRKDEFRVIIGTWNVGQGRATQEAMMSWLGSTASDVGIVVVGLQEVEMGAGFLAMSAAKETGWKGVRLGSGGWTLDNIGRALQEGSVFERMGSRQLAGLLVSLWVRKNMRQHVGDVDAGAVPCGFGRAIGNKGGVGLRIRVRDRIMCFVNCHLAAHLEAVNRRNADFDHIYRNMVFGKPSIPNAAAAAGMLLTIIMRFLFCCCSLAFSTYLIWILYYTYGFPLILSVAAGVSSSHTLKPDKASGGGGGNGSSGGSWEETKPPELSDADMVVFFGDFNYRLFGITYDEARDFVSQRSFDWLRERDQLRAEMKAGRVFQGMHEAVITFPPTYKFERNVPGLGGYDSGEKKRIPAWCDRVIFRDTRPGSATPSQCECSLECPVVSAVIQYEAVMDVNESDHKPVRCKFHIQVAHTDRSVRRQEFGEILRTNEKIQSLLAESRVVPETAVSTDSIALQNQDTAVLRIANKSAVEKVVFRIYCEGQASFKDEGDDQAEYRARGCHGFPRWLEVTPAAGIIKPENSMEVSVHHEEFHTLEDLVDGIPQNWWCEDTRDKEVILVVVVQGSSSTDVRTHRVHVRHCISAKTLRADSKSGSHKGGQRSGSSDAMDDSRSSQKP